MSGEAFLDSNILIYTFDNDHLEKRRIARLGPQQLVEASLIGMGQE